jgi:aspartate aminotransferase
MGPPDPIIGLNELFANDEDPRKTNLGVGAYRDDNGKPVVLPSVREAEKRIMESGINKEYAGIAGVKAFVDHSLAFAYGKDSAAIADGRIAGVQTLSGTGACRLAGEFFRKFVGENTPVYLPNPTWGNHKNIMTDAGLDIRVSGDCHNAMP